MFKALAALALAAVALPSSEAGAVDKTRLPVGDERYTTAAKKGWVYSCQTSFNGGGAQGTGPWMNDDGETWDLTKKIAVRGSVKWDSVFSARTSGSTRRLSGNGLPSHATGVYPVASDDPAYQYDRNPNSISEQSLSVSVPRNPKRAERPSCVGGQIGVMKSGVPLFSAFDAMGRDAAAHEVQDRCEGHPERTGSYHYHSLSSCIADRRSSKRAHSALIGWALDGFGIYGQYGRGGEQMATSKLDACHGHTHEITWDGTRVKKFHYHATLDFPYFVGCYRGTATRG
jgi:hypothetical protein